MSTVNLKEVKKIEFDVTKKLFKYIYTNINLNKVIEDLDREYSYFYDTDNNIAFNIWLSLDYIHKDGKTFTEKFLEDKSESLSLNEKKILEERKESYVSLFKIMKYDGEYTYVKDLLTEEKFTLLEPELENIIGEGEYVFSRIGKSLDNYNFIGDINYLPASTNYDFKKNVIIDFNLARKVFKGLTMKDYLKRFGINLYKIYDEAILNVIETEDGLDLYRIDDLEEFGEFEDYLSLKMDEDEIDIHITNLSNLIPLYFASEDEGLTNLLDLDIDNLLHNSIDNALIISREELLSFVDTLKIYFEFLNKKNSNYEVLYRQISEINSSPFEYINHINSYESEFITDKNFSYHIDGFLNKIAINLIHDFDIFLFYIENKKVNLTQKKKLIKRNELFKIEEDFKNKTNLLTKSPNQKDFINIDFYYSISLYLGLLSIDGNNLNFNDLGIDYYELEENEKYSIVFEYFFKEILVDNIKGEKESLLKILSSMLISKRYPAKIFLIDDENLLYKYGSYLSLLGIIDYDSSKGESVNITRLGKRISNYLDQNKGLYPNNLVNLFEFQK